jgi:N utilization substance protein B
LKFRPDIGLQVIINEYVEIARAFYGETEARFVNGALDGIAADIRK